jgi:hypothetical protein
MNDLKDPSNEIVVVLVTTPKGQYAILGIDIAEDGARCHCCDYGYRVGSEKYFKEVERLLSDSVALKEWLLEYCCWDDWEESSTLWDKDKREMSYDDRHYQTIERKRVSRNDPRVQKLLEKRKKTQEKAQRLINEIAKSEFFQELVREEES